MSKSNCGSFLIPEADAERDFVNGVIQGLRDLDEGREITLDKLKARLKRLITHQVTFETVPQQATLSPGRCFRLAMETVAYANPRNGAILADGTITASEALADGTYDVLLWDGVGQIQEVQLQVLGGKAVGQSSAVFTLADVFGTETTYKVQSMAFNEAGNIEVTALHSHMLGEQPRLFFMHFWANDDALKLARGKAA